MIIIMSCNPHVCFLSVFLNYFDNPGGMIPTWLVNWAAKVSECMFDFNMYKQ